jgi:3-oxoacyl-[acyl-carrier-protein] synthase III
VSSQLATRAGVFERPPLRSGSTAGIAAVAAAVPPGVVGNAAVAERVGVDEDWILARTGVRERRHAGADESLAGLASEAGRKALQRAGIEAADVDLVLVGSVTQDDILPGAAPLIAEILGARRAGSLDVGAACAGFLAGLQLGAGQIEAERAEVALVVGADLMSRIVDHCDRGTAALFGDGAGAAVLTAGGPGRIGPVLLRTDGSGADCVRASHSERAIRMRGQDTFRAAVERLCECTLEACDASEMDLEGIDLFVYHQANARITRAVGERLGLPPERVVDCIEHYGNTSAASVPIALAEAEADGRLRRGGRVLVGAFAAGFVWGAGVVEW